MIGKDDILSINAATSLLNICSGSTLGVDQFIN